MLQPQKLHKPQKLLKPHKPKKSHSAAIESILGGQDFCWAAYMDLYHLYGEVKNPQKKQKDKQYTLGIALL